MVTQGDDTLHEIDPATHDVIHSVTVGEEPDAVAVAPGGTHGQGIALVANLGSNTVTPVDLGTWRSRPSHCRGRRAGGDRGGRTAPGVGHRPGLRREFRQQHGDADQRRHVGDGSADPGGTEPPGDGGGVGSSCSSGTSATPR